MWHPNASISKFAWWRPWHGLALACLLPCLAACNGRIGDIALYHYYCAMMTQHLVPYRDFALEYPPVAAALFMLPGLFGLQQTGYAFVFVAMMAMCDTLQKIVLWRMCTPRHRLPVVLMHAFIGCALYYTYLKRFDPAVALLCLLAVAALMGNPRSLLAWALLGLGVTCKLYPALLAPVMIVHAVRNGANVQTLAKQGMVAAGTVLGVLGGAYALAGTASLSWVTYHADRGLHVASSYGAIAAALHGMQRALPADYTFGSLNITETWGAVWAMRSTWITLVLLAVTWSVCLCAPRSRRTLWRGLCASLLAVLLGAKVFSPQFVAWIAPFAALASFDDDAQDFWLAALILMFCGATAQLFPGESGIAVGDMHRQVWLVVRFVLHTVLWLYLLWRLVPQSLATTYRGANPLPS